MRFPSMRVHNLLTRLAILSIAVCTVVGSQAQQPQTPPTQSPDVVRVTTSLVQTDVMVFDKQGKFIDNLKPDQFVLKVDGKPRDISFFERVRAGSSNEEVQLAAARGTTSNAGAPVPLDRGRLVFFFIDDLHLAHGSLHRVRSLLARFVEREAGQNDRIAIVTATGQSGFLQQLTDNKAVLRRAIERLSPRERTSKDFERPPMSEHQAELIDRNDRDVLGYFVDALVRDGVPRETAEQTVRQRASVKLEQSAHFSVSALQTLQQLVKSTADLPGRKLVFFISDGFLVHARDSVRQRVNDLTAQAARNGVVIYSIDARGLVASLDDPADPGAFDPTGRLQRASGGELMGSQDGMHALAVDTGGRALFNTNDLSQSVRTGLAETSQYYLLAWRPDSDEEKRNKDRRLEVAIAGRPELIIRFRRNLADGERQTSALKNTAAKSSTPAETLRDALRAEHPKTSLPVHVTANFVNLANGGSMLASSVKIGTAKIPLETTNGTATAQIDLAIAILNDQGASVKVLNKTLTLHSTKADLTPPDYVVYHDYSPITPGLYQVRAAAAERKERRAGSAHEWIEIPNVESKTLAMSSLIVAEKPTGKSLDASADANSQRIDDPFKNLQLNIERRFARDSHLRFLTFVYNAATTASPNSGAQPPTAPAGAFTPSALPDLAIQVQVFRDGQPVITTPTGTIQADGASDLKRVPYAADVSLEGLQSGNYVLQVTVIDRIAKTSASEQFKFQVD